MTANISVRYDPKRKRCRNFFMEDLLNEKGSHK